MGAAKHSSRQPTLIVDPRLRQTIIDTEQLLKDDELTNVLMNDELEYHEDGYPKLPKCLDRCCALYQSSTSLRAWSLA
jgi:hypothetical protein